MKCATRVTALVIFWLGAAALHAADPQFSIAPVDGVLLLRNGYVLSGQITPQGDHYLIRFGESGEARLPRGRVERVCRDLQEAYFTLRDQLDRTKVEAHLELANWCLRQNLPARAADQILAAMLLDPSHPQIGSLERRLFRATQQQSRAVPSAQAKEASGSQEPKELSASDFRGLPPDAIERFRRDVQPLLLNSCATNACHGSAGQSQLQLLRPRVGRVLTSRRTQRNMHAALRFVDRTEPSASDLLKVPAVPHGGMEDPVFDEADREAVAALRDWIKYVSPGENAEAKQKDAPHEGLQHEEEGFPPQVEKPEPVLMQGGQDRGDWPHEQQTPPEGRRTAQRPAAQQDEFVPRDPFDPAIFNRRYFPDADQQK